jgi:hypothetical protein
VIALEEDVVVGGEWADAHCTSLAKSPRRH